MLRNLDALTNEEGVLTAMQSVIPTLVSKISKILICRDPLTSTSRGICYLSFDNLVDSMNIFNALKSVEPPLNIDNRLVRIFIPLSREINKWKCKNFVSGYNYVLCWLGKSTYQCTQQWQIKSRLSGWEAKQPIHFSRCAPLSRI